MHFGGNGHYETDCVGASSLECPGAASTVVWITQTIHTVNASAARLGMIFFFHNPKAGGTWMRTVVQQYSFANVTTGTKTLSRDLGNLLEAKFHGQVILFHHHCEAIYMKRALPMVLEFKAKAQAAGFIFDIITSIREPDR